MKDRLKELRMGNVKVVKKGREPDDEDAENGESGKLQPLGMDDSSKMDKLIAVVDVVAKELNLMGTLFVQVQKLHSLLLTESENKEATDEVNRLTEQFTDLAKRCNGLIKDLDKEVMKKGQDVELQAAENRIRRDQVSTLFCRLRTVCNKMNEEQLAYKAKSRKIYQEYLKLLGTDLPEDVLAECIEKGNLQEHVKGIILSHDQTLALSEDVTARTEDIVKLDKSIQELAAMFADMHLLVETQVEILNNIEQDVGRSAEVSVMARQELIAAKKTKKRFRLIRIVYAVTRFIMRRKRK